MGLKHNGQDYTVKVTSEPIGEPEDGARAILGRMDQGFNSITIDGTMPRSRQEEVLLHEAVHLSDMDVPEFVVKNIADALYGILSENELFSADWFDRVVDGVATREEVTRIEEANKRIQEGVGIGSPLLLRVSDASWAGWTSNPVLPEAGEDLPVHEEDGKVNRNACYMLAGLLVSGQVQGSPQARRSAAQSLMAIYRDRLDADPPPGLIALARR